MNDFGSPEGSLQPASRRGRSSSSRPGDPSSSSGGPPPPPPPSTGATMSGKVLGAVAAGGRGAWEALKFGGEAFGAVSSLVGDVVDTGMKIYGEPSGVAPPRDYQPWSDSMRPSSTPGQARLSVAIPREAPAPRPKSRARAPSRAPSTQTRGRSQRRSTQHRATSNRG